MTESGREIDWDDVKGRLKKSTRALKHAMNPGAAHVKSIYRQRAARLAQRRGKEGGKTLLPVLSFWIGGEHYAVAMSALAEVLASIESTPIPGAPPELEGVVNLHGEIRPVLDACKVLGLAKREGGGEGNIVFLRRKKNTEVGMRVDRIDEVRLINEDELTVPGSEASGLPARFIRGVTPDTLILIDTQEILSLKLLRDEK